jgi:uncharacterized protein (DUF2141 family)
MMPTSITSGQVAVGATRDASGNGAIETNFVARVLKKPLLHDGVKR